MSVAVASSNSSTIAGGVSASDATAAPALPPQPTAGAAPRAMTAATRVSVVIPCYNEQDVLPMLYSRLDATARTWGTDYEVILVDDGSADDTRAIAQRLNAENPRWKLISLARNFGHQRALWTGLGAATGDVVVVLDADLQDPPEVLPPFFQRWMDGYDVIYGVRQQRKEGAFKRSAYYLFYRILSYLSEVDMPLDSGDFCVMDGRVARLIASVPDQRPFVRGLRAWLGFKQIGQPYERHARAAGEVKYTFRKLCRLAFDGIFASSIRPLRVATLIGVVVSVLSFALALFAVVQRIFAHTFEAWGFPIVPGYYTLTVAVCFLGGVQLLCVGILGEYIGRIYENIKGRPASVVAYTLGLPAAPADAARTNPADAPTPR